jgi:hypothetical protein
MNIGLCLLVSKFPHTQGGRVGRREGGERERDKEE